jgi:hypothetical protein
MTSPLRPTRRRADEFARLLEAVPAGGPGPLGTTDPAFAPLVGLAQALRSVPLGPSPDFQAVLRKRLVAVASIQFAGDAAALPAAGAGAALPSAQPISERLAAWAVSWRGQRRLTVATAGVAAVVLVGGVGLAGSRSLPGDPFYGVKRGTERAQLALTFGTEAKGERHLQFAKERLDEVRNMVGTSQALPATAGINGYSVLAAPAPQIGGSLTSRIIDTLKDMDAETRAGRADLIAAYTKQDDTGPLTTLEQFSREQYYGLQDVYAAIPPGAKPAAVRSVMLVISVAKSTRALLDMEQQKCTEACASTGGTTGGRHGDRAGGSVPDNCTCATTPTTNGSTPTTPGGTDRTPHPTLTPGPGSNGTGGTGGGTGGSGDGTGGSGGGPTPSPTKSTLQDQIGGILSNLPIPSLSPPALPGAPLPPVLPKVSPLPTIHLP